LLPLDSFFFSIWNASVCLIRRNLKLIVLQEEPLNRRRAIRQIVPDHVWNLKVCCHSFLFLDFAMYQRSDILQTSFSWKYFNFDWIFMQPLFSINSTDMILPDQGCHILPCFARFAGNIARTRRQ
jgi:hypothetical protein